VRKWEKQFSLSAKNADHKKPLLSVLNPDKSVAHGFVDLSRWVLKAGL